MSRDITFSVQLVGKATMEKSTFISDMQEMLKTNGYKIETECKEEVFDEFRNRRKEVWTAKISEKGAE